MNPRRSIQTLNVPYGEISLTGKGTERKSIQHEPLAAPVEDKPPVTISHCCGDRVFPHPALSPCPSPARVRV